MCVLSLISPQQGRLDIYIFKMKAGILERRHISVGHYLHMTPAAMGLGQMNTKQGILRGNGGNLPIKVSCY